MTNYVYNPTDGSEVTSIFGQTVEAGDSLDASLLTDAQKEKLARHPEFQGGQAKAKADASRAKQDEKTRKVVETKTTEARAARAKASSADQEAAALERAQEQAEAVASARAADQPFPSNESQ